METTVWDELLKALPTILLLLLLIGVVVKLYDVTHPNPYSAEEKDLQRVVSEIKDLGIKSDEDYQESITVPLFSSKGYSLSLVQTITSDQKTSYSQCNMDYCACYIDNSTKKPVICETFNLRSEFGLEKTSEGRFPYVNMDATILSSNTVTIKREGNLKQKDRTVTVSIS